MHPDWAYRTAAGEIVDYNGDVHACINGDYQQIYALESIKELITTYEVDGICHCQSCQAKFSDMFGLALPKSVPPPLAV